MAKEIKGRVMLFLAALIWGSSFIYQSKGMEHVEPFTFNACRSVLGTLVLIPVVIFFRNSSKKEHPITKEEESALNSRSCFAGILCGLALSAASCAQQFGICTTSAGKAAFITSLYIIIVPILGVLLKKSVPKIIWLCAMLSLLGFYLLCMDEGFSIAIGDFYCLLGAFGFSIQIMCIDYFTKHEKKADPILMSLVQFSVVTIVSGIFMFIFEKPSLSSIYDARMALLFTGVLSSGGAYTFQIVGQKYTNPAIAPLIMSLESVIAALFGWFFLHESMTSREILGCAFVFLAVIMSQIPISELKNRLH